MPYLDESVIDRVAVQGVIERSSAMLRQSPAPATGTADTAEVAHAHHVRAALTRFRDSAEDLLGMGQMIAVRPPDFGQFTDVKLAAYIVDTEKMQQSVMLQAQGMTELGTSAIELDPLGRTMANALQGLFNVLETHKQAARKHEADRAVTAGGTKKSGNVGVDPTAGAPVQASHQKNLAVPIAELRRRAGLTWEQLARLFGTNRRSVHLWASGAPMSSVNEGKLLRTLAVVQAVDRGTAAANRQALLSVFDLLVQERYQEAINGLGESHACPREANRMARPSRRTYETFSPADLLDAVQDIDPVKPGERREVKIARVKSAQQ